MKSKRSSQAKPSPKSRRLQKLLAALGEKAAIVVMTGELIETAEAQRDPSPQIEALREARRQFAAALRE